MFGVIQPPRTPAYVLHYYSCTPPLFRSQSVLCHPLQVLAPSSLNLEIFGTLQGTRRIFLYFPPINGELKFPHTCGQISLKFAMLHNLVFGFSACVNRRRASSRKYRQLAPVPPKLWNHELAFLVIERRPAMMICTHCCFI